MSLPGYVLPIRSFSKTEVEAMGGATEGGVAFRSVTQHSGEVGHDAQKSSETSQLAAGSAPLTDTSRNSLQITF